MLVRCAFLVRCPIPRHTKEVRWSQVVLEPLADGGTKEAPVGDCCQKCASSKSFFPSLSWEDFSAKYNDGSISQQLVDAGNVEAGSAARPFQAASVATNDSYEVQISRDFLVLNNRELLRSLPGPPDRIPKRMLDSLPVLRVQSEDKDKVGELEEVYLFADPGQPWRRATISNTFQVQRQAMHLAPARHCREEQAAELATVLQRDHQAEAGEGDALAKLKGQNLRSLSEFQQKFADECAAASEAPGAETSALVAGGGIRTLAPVQPALARGNSRGDLCFVSQAPLQHAAASSFQGTPQKAPASLQPSPMKPESASPNANLAAMETATLGGSSAPDGDDLEEPGVAP